VWAGKLFVYIQCEAGKPSPFLLSLDGESKMDGAKTLASTGCLFFGHFLFDKKKKVTCCRSTTGYKKLDSLPTEPL